MSSPLTTAMSKVVELLNPLSSEERKRVVQAAFALLGEDAAPSSLGPATNNYAEDASSDTLPKVHATASQWLKRTGVTQDQLDQHLYFDGGTAKVISLPGGASKRIHQVMNTYLMLGIAAFLSTGEASFTDKDARELCEHFGCYDATNHAKYIKEFGNKITGSKSSGWKLTAPGLNAAAELVKS